MLSGLIYKIANIIVQPLRFALTPQLVNFYTVFKNIEYSFLPNIFGIAKNGVDGI